MRIVSQPLSTGVGVVYMPVEMVGQDQAIHADSPSGDVHRAITIETDELDYGWRPGLTLPNPDAVNT